ncbi:MAG: replicative DNA helicase [Myxococcota bacterium]|mgnify:CR=1 FL=1|nr:hypothetical protein [Myxococcales bacterium]MEC7751705.1 replicative DNA helicase [Myxococcota bacterium]
MSERSGLPYDLEAERALLGGLMLAYELDPEQIRHLEPDDFFAADNREIFRVIAEAIESGVDSIPSLAVVDRLRQSGALQAAGGAENVDRIVEEQMVPKAGIEEAADVVRRLSQLRQLITTAREIIETAQDKSVDLDSAVERAENAVLAIRERRSGENPMRSMVTISKNLAERMAKGDWGTDRGLRTGFERLDHQLGGFCPGHVIILAARPGGGKTSLALTMAARSAALNQCGVAFFSLEMPGEELVERLLASLARLNMHGLKREPPLPNKDPEQYYRVMSQLSDALAQLDQCTLEVDDSPGISLADLRQRVRRYKRNLAKEHPDRPLGLIVIDYLQLMKAPNLGSGANREQQVAYISKGLKALAKEEELCVLALAQLNRGVEKEGALSDDGKTKKKREPVLSDLRESGSIEQDADAVLAVHHPDDDDDEADANRAPGDPNNAVLLLLKNRHGPRKRIKMNFFRPWTLFTEQVDPETSPEAPVVH